MMLERLLILLVVGLLAGGGYILWQTASRRRLQRALAGGLPKVLAGRVAADGPVLLYFTTEFCGQCRLQQAPILQELAASTAVDVHAIDAVEQAELADFFGVMTVPTTIVLDRQHRPAAVNHGLATLAQLQQQLGAAGV